MVKLGPCLTGTKRVVEATMKRLWLMTCLGLIVPAACGGSDDDIFVAKSDSGADASGEGGDLGCGECAETERCDPLPGECVACLFDHDCADGERCEGRRCEPIVSCENSIDCKDAPGDKQVCADDLGECVECVGDADCGEGGECLEHRCRLDPTCESSATCPSGRVCDSALGRCVACSVDADCSGEQQCIANACVAVISCSSDKECIDMNMLCNAELARCVECKQHRDCPDVYHCVSDRCVLDVCDEGQSRCEGDAIVSCNDVGDAFGASAACEAGVSCVEQGKTASCGTPDAGAAGAAGTAGAGGASGAAGAAGASGSGGTGGAAGASGQGGSAGSCNQAFYRDADDDGFGNPSVSQTACSAPSGYVGNDDDCHDGNANAKPGQTSFFATDRGDGSFDYNCDNASTQKDTTTGSCSSFPLCNVTQGWQNSVPSCGVEGDYITSCVGASLVCATNTDKRTQSCR
jgi:hypothetical protein